MIGDESAGSDERDFRFIPQRLITQGARAPQPCQTRFSVSLDGFVECGQSLQKRHLIMRACAAQMLFSRLQMQATVHNVQSSRFPRQFGGLVQDVSGPIW